MAGKAFDSILNLHAPRLPRPRRAGLMLLALGLAACVFDVYDLEANDRFWGGGLILGPTCVLLGLWRLVVGQPWDEDKGRMKVWVGAGDLIAGGLGLAIAIALYCRLKGWLSPWPFRWP